jgi:4-amino-4-deoxy-L-arabinose transferase-like glycosyltransferase
VLTLVGLVRVRYLDAPLERDEGEYAYAGQLILQGVPPYAEAYNMKLPGTYYAYAGLMAIFGEDPSGIRLGLLLITTLSAVLLFVAARRLYGDAGAAVAASVFAILAADHRIMGTFAHATHFVLPPAIGAYLLLTTGASRSLARVFGAGVLLGLAILMKQHAAVFVVPALGLVSAPAFATRPVNWRTVLTPLLLLGSGVALPIAGLASVLYAEGVLGRAWFWTIEYAAAYVSQISVAEGLSLFQFAWNEMTMSTLPFWLLASAGLVVLWRRTVYRRSRALLSAIVAASALAVVPGLYFRQHYFIVMLPAVGVLVGLVVVSIADWIAARRRPAVTWAAFFVLLAGAAGSYVVREWPFLTSWNGRQLTRSVYSLNPFVEAPEIGRYIRANSAPGDRIAVLGSEPEIYFYARRRAATGYVYTYPLMEPHPFASTMQREMIREIEEAAPIFLVLVMVPGSWTARLDSDPTILNWMERYARVCYAKVGLVDIQTVQRTEWHWDELSDLIPRSSFSVHLYRRDREASCRVGPVK